MDVLTISIEELGSEKLLKHATDHFIVSYTYWDDTDHPGDRVVLCLFLTEGMFLSLYPSRHELTTWEASQNRLSPPLQT